MRADLLDAYAAVEWGETELPLLTNKFHAWRQTDTEIAYSHSEPGKKVAVFRKKGELPSIVNAGIGSIINSYRTALDILAAALARRNGISPSSDTHFPICANAKAFAERCKRIERKKWLSKSELSILKNLSPYNGGDPLIWTLHQLDILRKHERLIYVLAEPAGLITVGTGVSPKFLISPSLPLEDKTPLFELPADAPEPKTGLDFQILFKELALPAVHGRPVFVALADFRRTAAEIIGLFDV